MHTHTYWDQSFSEFSEVIQHIAQSAGGAEVLGSLFMVLMSSSATYSKSIDKVLEHQDCHVSNPQSKLLPLHSSLSVHKINHLIRTVPPEKASKHLHCFDEGLCHSYEWISLLSMSDFLELCNASYLVID